MRANFTGLGGGNGVFPKSDAKVLLFYDMGNSLSPKLWYLSPQLVIVPKI